MRVVNFNHLKHLASNENGDMQHFYIVLAGGLARSSKRIRYDVQYDSFDIIHEIDESYQEINSEDLEIDPIFKSAIAQGCLFMSDI